MGSARWDPLGPSDPVGPELGKGGPGQPKGAIGIWEFSCIYL